MSSQEKSRDASSRPVLRPGIDEIALYQAGEADSPFAGPVYKLSSNEGAFGPSPAAVEALRGSAADMHLYPEGSGKALRDAIGAVHGLDPELIVCGAGSDELLALLARAFLGPGDTIVMSRHGFSVYPIVARACGAATVYAEEVALTAHVDNLLAAVTDETRLLFLANPNNPTGTMLPARELARLRAGLREDIVLVLDAAYAEYVEEGDYDPGTELVNAAIANGTDNVIMTRTFSKIYGLGGLRLGWAYGPPFLIDALNRLRGPFNISAPAIAAGIAAVEDRDFVARNIGHNRGEKARLFQVLAGAGFGVTPGEGNFLLLQCPETDERSCGSFAADFSAYLKAEGVLVRNVRSYFLEGYLRVTIGSREANDRFLALTLDYMEEHAT